MTLPCVLTLPFGVLSDVALRSHSPLWRPKLRWGLTIFWQKSADESHWYEALVESLADQGIRILSWRWKRTNVLQFAISTIPTMSPGRIVKSVREVLQSQIRNIPHAALRQRYAIRSFGTQERKIVEAYIANQPSHHPMATNTAQELFESLTLDDAHIDLSQPRHANGGIFWYNLHIAMVYFGRWRCTNREWLVTTQNAVVATSQKKQWRLSRLSLVADHLHFSVGCSLEDSPLEVVLSTMNNIA